MPELTALILLARAILGDAAAAREVADRLGRQNTDVDYEVVEILRPRFKPVLDLIDGGVDASEAVFNHAHSLRIAIYDANEAVSEPTLLVA